MRFRYWRVCQFFQEKIHQVSCLVLNHSTGFDDQLMTLHCSGGLNTEEEVVFLLRQSNCVLEVFMAQNVSTAHVLAGISNSSDLLI